MVDIAVLFGADKDRATQELKESLDFEIKLANVSKTLQLFMGIMSFQCHLIRSAKSLLYMLRVIAKLSGDSKNSNVTMDVIILASSS